MRNLAALSTLLVARVLGAVTPVQVPLRDVEGQVQHPGNPLSIERRRPLHGRFLHITDFHPDPFYETYSSTTEEAACHRGEGPAGIYGAETSECDSPIALINKTLEWVAEEWRDKVDFVVWTGDSARHDNDDDVPRSAEQVFRLNEFMVTKMAETFGKHNGDERDGDPNNDFVVPIIPTFGNNDILPHNIFDIGPNRWTREYTRIWRQFIPEEQKHSFEQGGWYYVEVIPNQLAVFSLNSLYFFAKNAATDGCAAPSEPGYRQMEWLRIQLQFMRQRGMKAILTGHVPPARQEAKTQWDETCWQKYALWLQQYRDVVVTSLYGHFNYDHFATQDFEDIDDDIRNGRMADESEYAKNGHDDVSALGMSDYFVQLRDEWARLPQPPKAQGWWDSLSGGKKKQEKKEKKYLEKMGGEFAERFAASFVAASVVPNSYPTLRVFEYNITGLEQPTPNVDVVLPVFSHAFDDFSPAATTKKGTKHKFIVPDGPSKSSPPGPAYSPQTLSLLKYTQYFANLTTINNDFTNSNPTNNKLEATKWHEGKHKGEKPHNKDHEPQPKKFKFELHYDTQDDKIYHMKDLTMPNVIDLARRIGNYKSEEDDGILDTEKLITIEKKKKHKKNRKHTDKHQNDAWFAFVRRAYVETLTDEDMDDDFR